MKNKKGSESLRTRPQQQSWGCAACCCPPVCELLLPLLLKQQPCASPEQLRGVPVLSCNTAI